MYISRVIIKNYRNLKDIDLFLDESINCIVGENNSGKTNLLNAIRLALDANLPNFYRTLNEEDFSNGVDISHPEQIMIAIQLKDYSADTDDKKIKEHALMQEWEIDKDLAQICYRFLPNQKAKQQLIDEEINPGDLTIENYGWEVGVGLATDADGKKIDIENVTWKDGFADQVKFNRLSSYKITFLHAVRDVEEDLRIQSKSPLNKLIKVADLPDAKKQELVQKIKDVNGEISNEEDIKKIAEDINESFDEAVGSIYKMETKIGMASPTFRDVSRALRVLLSGQGLTEADLSRNGLGLNNVLYISMLLDFFKKEIAKDDTAGELILIEEPEAHLHPQLQRILFSRLSNKNCQTLVTTHSTHITSNAYLSEQIILTKGSDNFISTHCPGDDEDLEDEEEMDLERYLDATKSTLLYAKKVILVEGMSEVFLIPEIVKKVMDIDLAEHGISIIPIHGVHFKSYLKLFGSEKIRKKCAVITDGDLQPSDSIKEVGCDDFPKIEELKALENDYLKIFNCKTTFERAMALPKNCLMFANAAEELGSPENAKILKQHHKNIDNLTDDDKKQIRDKVLSTAKRFGKARFAQVAVRYVDSAESIPNYLKEAIDWILQDEAN